MLCLALLLLSATTTESLVHQSQPALLQTWEKALDGDKASAKITPVTRVVNLLKEITGQLEKDMEEDETLFNKLSCWCNNNEYGKDNSIAEAEAKIESLESKIESLTARSAQLNTEIADTEKEVAADKDALATATALREKEASDFHAEELDAIQALENLKAAMTVLSKHHEAAFPQLSLSFLQGKALASRSVGDWKDAELDTVKKALRSVASFAQSKQESAYYPSYNAQSGEIMGVLKQMNDEMNAELKTSQERETNRAASFAELRASKSEQINSGEASAERKEDERATANNDLAEAKEDLGQTNDALSEDQKFLKNMKQTCAEAETNFNERKNARQEEMKAVAETIEILTADEARDANNGAFTFIQMSVSHRRVHKVQAVQRQKVAALLRSAALKTKSPMLSVLATSVQLDAFEKVKKAINDMLTQLNQQMADEVKKTDWCKSEIQSNDMATMKAKDLKADLEAKIGSLGTKIETLAAEIEEAKAGIAGMQVELQRASETRKGENMDFQKTVEDQTMTIEVLNKALDRLSNYYDNADLLQVKGKQTPPVAQMEYKKSKGAGGVVSMIEKLIFDARELRADAKKGEQASQAAYEELVASTNGSVAALQAEVAAKTKAKAQTAKDKMQTESDLSDTEGELDEMAKLDADLHGECDYVLKNFDVRQQARAQEIEALQQAEQILSGANMR